MIAKDHDLAESAIMHWRDSEIIGSRKYTNRSMLLNLAGHEKAESMKEKEVLFVDGEFIRQKDL